MGADRALKFSLANRFNRIWSGKVAARKARKVRKEKHKREQEKMMVLPQCVEEMLEGYFKRRKQRRNFEFQAARGLTGHGGGGDNGE